MNGGRLVVVAAVAMAVGAGLVAWAVARPSAVADLVGRDVTGRLVAWYLEQRQDALAPPGASTAPVIFHVAQGESVGQIAARLEDAGLIRSAADFGLLASASGLDRGIQAGDHPLHRAMSAREVLAVLQAALAPGIRVTLPEGRRAEELAEILEAAGLGTRADFLAQVRSPARSRSVRVVGDRPAEADLEGYLAPDTYDFDPDAGMTGVIDRLVDAFSARWTASHQTAATLLGLTPHEVVILASIVEREAVVAAERPRIARVFLNRLATPPRLLDADPTIQFGLGFDAATGAWWKRPLTADDLRSGSPYNTYQQPGLPPGPICSPGWLSIAAVLAPEAGPWHYFVADGQACDGTHLFAVTYEEHLANVELYRQSGCD